MPSGSGAVRLFDPVSAVSVCKCGSRTDIVEFGAFFIVLYDETVGPMRDDGAEGNAYCGERRQAFACGKRKLQGKLQET